MIPRRSDLQPHPSQEPASPSLSGLPWETQILIVLVAVTSLFAFVAYGLDKRRARLGQRRTPESSLLALAAIGGAPGALLGMKLFRHKTAKGSFQLKLVLALLPNLIWYYLGLRRLFG